MRYHLRKWQRLVITWENRARPFHSESEQKPKKNCSNWLSFPCLFNPHSLLLWFCCCCCTTMHIKKRKHKKKQQKQKNIIVCAYHIRSYQHDVYSYFFFFFIFSSSTFSSSSTVGCLSFTLGIMVYFIFLPFNRTPVTYSHDIFVRTWMETANVSHKQHKNRFETAILTNSYKCLCHCVSIPLLHIVWMCVCVCMWLHVNMFLLWANEHKSRKKRRMRIFLFSL